MRKRKLILNRETVMPLDRSQLDPVQGGSVVSWVTKRICVDVSVATAVEASKAISGRIGGGGGGGGGGNGAGGGGGGGGW